MSTLEDKASQPSSSTPVLLPSMMLCSIEQCFGQFRSAAPILLPLTSSLPQPTHWGGRVGKAKALMLSRCCSAVVKTLVRYQCCFNHKTQQHRAVMTKTNSIPARPSITIINIAGWGGVSGGREELYPKRLRKAFRPGKDKQDIPATFQAAQSVSSFK